MSGVDQLASKAAPAIRSGRLQQSALVSELLERYESSCKFYNMFQAASFNPEALKAAVAPPPEGAGKQAEKPRGALAGVPFVITPNIDVVGLSTNGGTETLAIAAPEEDAAAVAALKKAGALLFGATNAAELNQGALSTNALNGTVRNPYTGLGVAGGSAGGAAAVVSSRVAPLALALDSGGDVRVPAALCGVVGFRPTHGRYTRDGLLSLSPTLDSLGIIARSVADVQLADAVVCAAQAVPVSAAASAAAATAEAGSDSKEADDPQKAAAVKMQSVGRGFLSRRRAAKAAAPAPAPAPAPAAAEGEGEEGGAPAPAPAPPVKSKQDELLEAAEAAAVEAALAAGKSDAKYTAKMAAQAGAAADRLASLTALGDGEDVFDRAADAGSGAGAGAGGAGASGEDPAGFVKALAGVRIGIPRGKYYEGADPALAAVVDGFLSRLRKAGAVLVEADFEVVPAAGEGDALLHPHDMVADVAGPIGLYETPRELATYLYTHLAKEPEKKKVEGEEEAAEEPAEGEEGKPKEPPAPKTLDSVVSVTAVLEGYKGPARQREALLAQLARATAVSATTYRSALVYRRPALKRAFTHYMAKHKVEAILYPTTLVAAAAAAGVEGDAILTPAGPVNATELYFRNTRPASAAGLPALSIPVGLTRPATGAAKGTPAAERLPVAVELVANSGADERLLALGRAVQKLQSALPDPIVMQRWAEGVTY